MKHCRREAERLGEASPARAMRVVSEHAEAVVHELPALMKRELLPVSGLGMLVGRTLSQLRDKIVDRMIRDERSYRGTLLGMRHGVDLVRVLEHSALAARKLDLVRFCQSWLERRVPMLERAERELEWFAEHPDRAMRRATHAPNRSSMQREPAAISGRQARRRERHHARATRQAFRSV